MQLVIAAYRRPLDGRDGDGGRATGCSPDRCSSGSITELARIAQPLAGETAVYRAALDHLTVADGYGMEVALLIDV